MRKMLALDLDGTTFGEGTVLSEGNRRALLEARARGAVVCFVTGRKKLGPIIHLAELADYFVLNNGGTVIAMPGERQLYTTLVERSALLQLIGFCNENEVMLHMLSGEYWGINLVTPELEFLKRRYGGEPVFYRSADDLPFETIDGFVASGNVAAVRRYIEETGMNLYCAVSDALTMDIMPGGVNKWRGAAYVAQREGIARADVIGAGNYYNDLELIEGAGIGIAVRNAPEDVQSRADYVTERTHLEDAVAEMVERFIL